MEKRARTNTESVIVEDLNRRGYHLDFTLSDGDVYCLQSRKLLPMAEFEVEESHQVPGRFGTVSICGLNARKWRMKGVLILSS